MLNERKEPRFDSVLYLPVTRLDTGTRLGHLVNISEQGLMVVGSEELEPLQDLSLEIHIPEHFHISDRVIVGTQLRWCRPDANPDLFAYGLSISQPSTLFRELQRRLRAGFSFSG